MASVGKEAGASRERPAGWLVLQPALARSPPAAGTRFNTPFEVNTIHTGCAPTTAALAGRLPTQHARRAGASVDDPKLLAREEAESLAVGDQNGADASSVPASREASAESIGRTQMAFVPFAFAADERQPRAY